MSGVSSCLGLYKDNIREMNKLGPRSELNRTDHKEIRNAYMVSLQNLSQKILGRKDDLLKSDNLLRFAEKICFKQGLSKDQVEGENILNLAQRVVQAYRNLEIVALEAEDENEVRESLETFISQHKEFALGFSEALQRRGIRV